MSKFGDFIETIRKSRRMTIRDLAKRMGKSATYICDIEKGNRKPSDNNFYEQMAAALELDGDEKALFFDLAADPSKGETPKDIADYINEVPEAKAALRIAKKKASIADWEYFRRRLEGKQG